MGLSRELIDGFRSSTTSSNKFFNNSKQQSSFIADYAFDYVYESLAVHTLFRNASLQRRGI